MKVLINREMVQGPWGGGNNFVRAFREHVPKHGHQVVDRLEDAPNVVLLMGPGADGMGIDSEAVFRHRQRDPGCRVIARMNDCDARKGTTGVDRALWEIVQRADVAVFVSKWLQDHLTESWTRLPDPYAYAAWTTYGVVMRSYVVHNGVDVQLFRTRTVEERNRTKVVAHHWSDNPLKGRDVYEALDSIPFGVEFTYIGRHQCNFKNPYTRVVPPLFGDELANELANHDVYVSGSRFDPGPNHIAESIACGLPTYVHKDGGGCVEFAGADHVYNDIDHLRRIIAGGDFKPNAAITFSDWDVCIGRYVEIIERVHRDAVRIL